MKQDRHTSRRGTARWPFWLLLAAWFCANSPQAATYEIVVWLGEARHFSHQQRLSAEVAFILAGERAPAVMAAARAAPERPFAPPVPAEATLKKIDLLVTLSTELMPPTVRAFVPGVSAVKVPASPWREPPAEPPRVA